MNIEVIVGDITKVEVDAIVNAANSSLMGGGGVDGAIHRAAGPSLLEECRQIREQDEYRNGLPTGRAVATGAGNLPAKWVIHTVGPVYAEVDDPARLLTSCYVESLRLASELGAKSIAFPAISTGAFGYPMHEAADVSVRAIRSAKVKIDRVVLVCFDSSTADVLRRQL